MLVAPAMGPTVVRSSLEVMLDSLRQIDEKPKDLMPALPARPTSKGRLPPSRRSLPSKFNIGSKGMEENKKEAAFRVKIFGGKIFSTVEQSEESPYSKTPESPYSKMPESARCEERRPEQFECSVPSISPSTSEEPTNRKKLNCILRKDTRVWCGLPNAKWELGSIQLASEDVVHVKVSDGKVLIVSTENILPANPQILDGVDDLIQLSYLNEPSVLHNLQCRYSHDNVYTKAGPVLLALNPFKEVSLYGSDFVTAYRQKLLNCPHVFEIADTAYNEMMIDGKNQSIIMSGESGAGKTETTKFAMQYLAALGGGSGMEDEVTLTNLILESFGNAKTLRNDNSSRFGKLLEIQFSPGGKICGAKIQTFLLEKSRVVQRAMGERSYHVLYQLCAGAPPNLKEKLNLKEASYYEYLKQSNCLTIADVDDAQRFHMLTEALDTVKICKEDQENAFAMLATVLWLGNIGFSVVDNENHVEVDLSEGVNNAAKLLGCEFSDLMLALSARKLKAGNENIVQKLTLSEAIDTRDALAKAIYASLFDWLVEELNKSLEAENSCAERSISILDIYGFESFNRNSFEQLCINYANERLQQHYNRHLFKLEQEEYSQNGIDWKTVDFVDNTKCLNLFEKKQMGLLSLLDEESTTPRATDMTFANKLKQNLSDNFCFKGERGGAFRISHFAGEVLYNSSGFLEKNRDLLHSDFIQLLSSSCCRLPQLIASHMRNQLNLPDNPSGELDGGDSQKSVGAKFKDQLFKLMQRLESTTPHFIRCITPNSQHLPGAYEYDLVLRQLRCIGVLEVVRISRSVYPTRVTHQQFAERYGFFILGNDVTQDPLTVSVKVLQHFNFSPDMYQVGYMKLFFRTGQIAALEEVRHRTFQGIVCVQKHFRGGKARSCFQELKNGVTILQSFIRGVLGRKQFAAIKNLKRTKAFKHQGLSDTEEQPKAVRIPQPEVVHTDLDEFQRRALAAEAALSIKEDENLMLKQQIEQYETRWSDHEAKMQNMEEVWQKQLAALQTSLAEAKKSLAADDKASPPRHATSPNNYNFDAEEAMSVESQTPEGTPAKQSMNSESTHSAVSHMVKEFEQQKQVFEDDAGSLIEAKSGQPLANTNPEDDLLKLKARFAAWKKDYKVKLRDTKMAIQKLGGNSKLAKTPKKWWNLRPTK